MGFNVTEISGPIRVIVEQDEPLQNPRLQVGYRYVKGASVSTMERVTILDGIRKIGSDTGLVFEVGYDNVEGVSSFDDIPMYQTRQVWHDGNYFSEFKKMYFRRYEHVQEGVTYVYFLQCKTKLQGYLEYGNLFANGDLIYVGVYEGFRDASGKLRSIPNVHQTVSRSAENFLTDARLNDGLGVDSKYLITDLMENQYLLDRWLVKTANKDSQAVMLGATTLQTANDSLSLYAETSVNHVVLPTARASTFVVGQTIIVGSSTYRLITAIENDFPEVGQTAIRFDGETLDTTLTTNVSSRPWITGVTDNVSSLDGYYRANDGKYPIKFDGIENPFGNTWKNIAGIKILGDEIYVSSIPKDYNWNANTTNYSKLNYTVPRTNGYVSELGYDIRYPYAQITKTLGGSQSTFYGDYFNQNYAEGVYRTVLIGGTLNYGRAAGLRSVNVYFGLGAADWAVGSRLSYRPNKGVMGDTPPAL